MIAAAPATARVRRALCAHSSDAAALCPLLASFVPAPLAPELLLSRLPSACPLPALCLPSACPLPAEGSWGRHSLVTHSPAAPFAALAVPIPYNCTVDHWLLPERFVASPYLLRERSFLRHRLTPRAVREEAVTITITANASDGRASERRALAGGMPSTTGRSSSAHPGASGHRHERHVALPPAPSSDVVIAALAPWASAARLHFEDVGLALGKLADDPDGSPSKLLVPFHRDAQMLLGSWCCTSDVRFKRTAGLVHYTLPPLEGQSVWRGESTLGWVERAMRDSGVFH